MKNIDSLSVNTIRFLAVEAIQKANSGHPGLPMGAAPAAYTLFAKHLKYNAKNPKWENRDRFVLSAGHGSALLYSLYHLFGMGVTIDDLKNFRQLGSKTAGHPEYGLLPATEVTTGPLGQGIAMAVGLALAESHMAAKFNKPGYDLVDHYTYALCGDGCLMEGVASEAASLAGTLGLGKLIVLYDSNNITIEGSTDIAFTEDVKKRFEAYGWQTLYVADGNDVNAINAAIEEAKADKERPALIEIKTLIGYGAPNKQGKASAHGEPLGVEEIKLAKQALGWKYKKEFFVPGEVKTHMEGIMAEGEKAEKTWKKLLKEYSKEYPELAKEWKDCHAKKLPVDLVKNEDFWKAEKAMATRASSELILNRLAELVPQLIGGSADLGPSNKSVMKSREYYSKENRAGSNLHFGIREFAMTCIINAMALYGGLKPYGAGFFVFSDYAKSALRLAALMGAPTINVFTHDSIGVGEDGPTHQPIEQLAMLRSIPNFKVWRPCDTRETAAAWCAAVNETATPSALVLSRQDMPLLEGTGKDALKGAYILRGSEKVKPDIILMATGSEVSLACQAYDELTAKGIKARVVSMPCWEVFEAQSSSYKEKVLPKSVTKRLAIEAASSFGWHKYTGFEGEIMSIDTYGECGKGALLFEHFGFTAENVVRKAEEMVSPF